MWINPQTLDLQFKPQQTQLDTKEGYGIFHWRNFPPTLILTTHLYETEYNKSTDHEKPRRHRVTYFF